MTNVLKVVACLSTFVIMVVALIVGIPFLWFSRFMTCIFQCITDPFKMSKDLIEAYDQYLEEMFQ